MSSPYTYIVKHNPSGKIYYGCRFAKNCDPIDLWTTYFTSSKHVKALIETDGKESFTAEIRKTFDNVDQCRKWENRVLRKLDVLARQDIFLNKTNNISINRTQSVIGAKKAHELHKDMYVNLGKKMGTMNKGRKHSVESNAKKAQFGNKHKLGIKESAKTKLKKSIAHTGKSSGMLGKTHSKCSCICCGHETSVPVLKRHYKYYHADINLQTGHTISCSTPV